MKVRDIMDINVLTVHEDTTLREVVQLIRKYQMTGFPVVNEDNELLGIITDKDLLKAIYPGTRSLGEDDMRMVQDLEDGLADVLDKHMRDLMTKEVFSIGPEASVVEAGARMLANRIRWLPVIQSEKVVGLINRSMIFEKVIQKKTAKAAPDKTETAKKPVKPSLPVGRERRIYKRVKITVKVTYESVGEAAADTGPGQKVASTIDMSAGGMLLKLSESLKNQSMIDVAFELEGGIGKVQCLSRICRISTEPQEGFYQAGIIFLALGAAERNRIKEYIDAFADEAHS